ncbi:MAG: alpha/beta hydrolase [Acidobacteriaceae bacterium]
MASSIVGAKFVTAEGAGHALFVDQPQEFNDELQMFLNKSDAR